MLLSMPQTGSLNVSVIVPWGLCRNKPREC